ncbi:MAG: EVE domain-containing protein [Gemmatimonadales bacterium]
MGYWVVKTEPSTYSYDDLAREGTTVWDGVKNPVAVKHLRAMQPGDAVMIYHTGDEKAIVGLAKVVAQDQKLGLPKLTAERPVPRPVTLAAIKADKAFADLGLVRQGRLSVVPVPASLFQKLLKMSGAA